jgi:transposase
MARGKDIVSDIESADGMNQVQHRRRWTFFQKLRVAQEASAPRMSVTSVARKYGIAPSQLFRWRKLLLNGGQEIDPAGDQDFAHDELRELKRRMRELERLLGRATLENEILRETVALEKSRRQQGKIAGH